MIEDQSSILFESKLPLFLFVCLWRTILDWTERKVSCQYFLRTEKFAATAFGLSINQSKNLILLQRVLLEFFKQIIHECTKWSLFQVSYFNLVLGVINACFIIDPLLVTATRVLFENGIAKEVTIISDTDIGRPPKIRRRICLVKKNWKCVGGTSGAMADTF